MMLGSSMWWLNVLSYEIVQIGLMSVFFIIVLVVCIRVVEYYDEKKEERKVKSGRESKQYENTETRIMPTVSTAEKKTTQNDNTP